MMLQIKYHGPMPCGFRQGDFKVFPIKAYVKHVTPGGVILVPST